MGQIKITNIERSIPLKVKHLTGYRCCATTGIVLKEAIGSRLSPSIWDISWVSFCHCSRVKWLDSIPMQYKNILWVWGTLGAEKHGVLKLKNSEVSLHGSEAQSQTSCLAVVHSSSHLKGSGNRLVPSCWGKMDMQPPLTALASTFPPDTRSVRTA